MNGIDDLVAAVVDRIATQRPALVGLAGPVAAGKTTVARALADGLAEHGWSTQVIGTDAFLHPNAVLSERGIEMRKGFPESFDDDAIATCLRAIRHGELPVQIPVYSHGTYDIVPGARVEVDGADVVVVEGVNALQPPAVELVHVGVYVDADEAHVRDWFTRRLLGLVAAADADERSFYRRFATMDEAELRAFADGVWDAINGPNLREHIAPSKARADVVVRKDAAHEIVEVTAR